jgi:hypothetical protein
VGRINAGSTHGERENCDEGDLVKLPGVDRAVVVTAKIREYPLSGSRAVGRFKTTFFVALGYSAAGWERLAADLHRHAIDNEAVATQANAYGQKYEVLGRIKAPTGKSAVLVAVWIVLRGEEFPRLITAFPGAGS